MREFKHISAKTVAEATSSLSEYKGKAEVIAGGTDILVGLREEILPEYPEALIDLKTIEGMDYIREEGGLLKIGALTRLTDIAENETVRNKYTSLADAAHAVGTQQLRNMGTIGGNICQLNRCWYFRKRDNQFDLCIRKGGGFCYATAGDNRYHSIFGGVLGCMAVNPSDTAPALIALDAKVVTSKRTINAEDFWEVKVPGSTALDDDEIVTEIQIPEFSGKSAFIKFALRKAIDFPIVNCAATINGGAARVCLNAVFNNPYRATAAEEAIAGKSIDETNAEAAGEAAVKNAMPLTMNKWKIQIAKVMVKRAILACA